MPLDLSEYAPCVKPPYCPNDECPWHDINLAEKEGRFRGHGQRPVARSKHPTTRYTCTRCEKTFSDSIFSLSYRDRTPATYEQIFYLVNKQHSRRGIAEFLNCSLDTVQRRYRELSRQSLLIQAHKTKNLEIHESIAFDGIENFSFSQYDPNNINHAVGRETYFLYDFNYSPLNRKGRMSPRQKWQKKKLEEEFGHYPRNSVFSQSRELIERLLKICPGDLLFHSDNHYAYRDAIKSIKGRDRIDHFITPGKVARNFKNRLFAINHTDLLTRHHLAAFRRETIAFSKHSIAMIENFAGFMVYKNFMRPIFTKKHKRDPKANVESPAMRVKIESKILTFHEFFRVRLAKTQVKLNKDWAEFADKVDLTSRRKIAEY